MNEQQASDMLRNLESAIDLTFDWTNENEAVGKIQGHLGDLSVCGHWDVEERAKRLHADILRKCAPTAVQESSLEIVCPNSQCAVNIGITRQHAGLVVNCPICGQAMQVSDLSEFPDALPEGDREIQSEDDQRLANLGALSWGAGIIEADNSRHAQAVNHFGRAIETNPDYYISVIQPSSAAALTCWKEAVEKYKRKADAKAGGARTGAA